MRLHEHGEVQGAVSLSSSKEPSGKAVAPGDSGFSGRPIPQPLSS